MRRSEELKNIEQRCSDEFPVFLVLPYGRLGCPNNCVFCYEEFRKDPRPPEEIQKAVFEIYRRLRKCIRKALMVRLVDWGEPFMVPYLHELLDMVFSLNDSARVQLITNLYTQDEKVIAALAQRENTELYVSLNTSSRSAYERLAGRDGWEDVIGNVRKVQRRGEKNLPEICLGYVAINENVMELPDFVNLAFSLGVRKIAVQDIVMFDRKHERLGYGPMDREAIRESYAKAQQLARILGINFISSRNLPDVFQDHSGDDFVCHYPFSAMNVESTGDVLFCCHSRKVAGNVLEDDPLIIWQSPLFREARQAFRRGGVTPECAGCKKKFYGVSDSRERVTPSVAQFPRTGELPKP